MASLRSNRSAVRTVLLAIACAQFSVVPLLAHPTRTLVRSSPRVMSPLREHLRERAARHPLGKPMPAHIAATGRATASRPVRTFGAPAYVSNRISSNLGPSSVGASNRAQVELKSRSADPETLDRVHTWERTQREAAVQSSITAADAEIASLHTSPLNESGSSSVTDGTHPQAPVPASADLPLANGVAEGTPIASALPSLQRLLIYDNFGRLIVPAPLFGSHEVLLHQNQMAGRDGLTRVQNDAGLVDLLRQKKLVPLPVDETLRVDYRLPTNRRYSRPWTARFLAALAHDHFTTFHSPIQVDSAVRTVQFQRRLIRTNGNAAPAAGDTASPHLTGQAIDIAKSSLTLPEIAWMRAYLQPLIEAGKIDVEEEFQQACFHISVYKDYLPATPPHLAVATRQSPITTAY